MIRKARRIDIPRITDLMRECYGRSKFADLDLDERLFKRTCLEAIRTHGFWTCLFVAERADGVIEGFIIGGTGPIYGFGKQMFATDQLFYVTPGGDPRHAAGLFRAFVNWFEGTPNDVVVLQVAATNAVQDYSRVEELFRRHDLAQEGVLYSKRKTQS